MIIRNHVNSKMLIALLVMAVGLIFASTASAECGPGFSNKTQLIHYYKHNPSAAHGLRKELLAHPATGYQADETVLNWLRSPEQRVFNAPSGYQLTFNTECPGGAGQYTSCHGCLLGNMGGLPMLWHCPKSGKCIPVLKGYCMNFVCGPAVQKSPPECKCRKPKKPKCKCHHHHHHRVTCQSKGMIGTAGNCVHQSNNSKEECEAKVGGTWNGNQCTTTQINNNCGNVANGNEGTVVQGGEQCKTEIVNVCVGNDVCNESPPPCGCPPKEPEKPLDVEVKPEKTQEFEANETAKEAPICSVVRPGAGTTVLGVYFEAEYGHVENHKAYQLSAEKFCTESYKAPSGHPPFECTEPGLDPSAKWCDILTWTAEVTNGVKTIKVSKTIQAPWIPETKF